MNDPLNTIYMLYLQIRVIDILLLAIIWILYLKNKRLPFEKGKFFNTTLIAVSANMICDVVVTYDLYHFYASVKLPGHLWHRLFMVTMCLSMYFLHMYIMSLCDRYKKYNNVENVIRTLPAAVAVVCVMTAPVKFYIGDDGAYSYGPAVNITFAVMGIYFALSVFCVLLNHKRLNKKNIGNICIGLVVCAGFAIVQIVNPSILISGTGLILLMLMIYLNFGDSKIYVNYENGCFNSMAYRKFLNSYFKDGCKFYVAQISFHEFQLVHGKYGHDVCQKILKDMAAVIENSLKTRVFSVEEEVLGIILKDDEYNLEDIQKLIAELEYDCTINQGAIHITGILDLVYCPDEAESVIELEDIFDFMRRCRDKKKNFYRFDKQMFKEKERYADIVRILEHAISNDGFYMVYQPIYSVKRGDFHSAEALIRLKDDRSIGFISPEEFIPIAEKEGLIMKIGDIVLSKVCEFSQRVDLIGRGIEYIEVNLSAIQCIDQGLTRQIKDVVYKYELPYNFLNLEITETAAVSSGNMLNRNVETLRNMGASFSMDDFGTGYSNIAKMTDIQYEIIKLDKSLLWGCYPEQRKILMKSESEEKRKESIHKSMAVLTKIIELINDLKLKIVAEGVETKEMVDSLSEKGVDYLQGYYFSKPLQEDDFLRFIESTD